MLVKALMSAPAQNRNGLEDAITSARIGSGEALTASHTARRSATIWGDMEFIWPLASQAIATPSGTPAPVCSLTTSAGWSASGCG